MSPNRVVTVLTPLVFAPLAGAIAAWLAENFPGVEISQDQLTGIFITGALIAFGKSAQWLHGWQKWEDREASATVAADQADAAVATTGLVLAAASVAGDDDGLGELDGGVDDDDLTLEEELADDDDLGDEALDEDPLLDGELQPASNN